MLWGDFSCSLNRQWNCGKILQFHGYIGHKNSIFLSISYKFLRVFSVIAKFCLRFRWCVISEMQKQSKFLLGPVTIFETTTKMLTTIEHYSCLLWAMRAINVIWYLLIAIGFFIFYFVIWYEYEGWVMLLFFDSCYLCFIFLSLSLDCSGSLLLRIRLNGGRSYTNLFIEHSNFGLWLIKCYLCTFTWICILFYSALAAFHQPSWAFQLHIICSPSPYHQKPQIYSILFIISKFNLLKKKQFCFCVATASVA